MRKHLILSFAAFLAICFLVAVLGSIIENAGLDNWYQELQKPTYNPPNWIYGPVWTVLYIFIATSGWIVYQQEKSPIRTFILQLYVVQLVLNLLWTYLFFGLHSPLLALFDIVALLFTILYYIVIARNIARWASLLFVPYGIWISFATLLNLSIWILNPS